VVRGIGADDVRESRVVRSLEHGELRGTGGGRGGGESIVVFGCSGGGDLALEVGTRTKSCVVVPEEPASVVNGGLHA